MQSSLPPRLVQVLFFGTYAAWLVGVVAYVGWIYRDAAARGSENPFRWGVGALLFGPLVLLAYLPKRRGLGARPEPPSRVTKAFASVGAGLWVSFVLGAFFAPPDPFTQVLYAAGSLVVTAPLAYVLIFLVPEEVRTAGA